MFSQMTNQKIDHTLLVDAFHLPTGMSMYDHVCTILTTYLRESLGSIIYARRHWFYPGYFTMRLVWFWCVATKNTHSISQYILPYHIATKCNCTSCRVVLNRGSVYTYVMFCFLCVYFPERGQETLQKSPKNRDKQPPQTLVSVSNRRVSLKRLDFCHDQPSFVQVNKSN